MIAMDVSLQKHAPSRASPRAPQEKKEVNQGADAWLGSPPPSGEGRVKRCSCSCARRRVRVRIRIGQASGPHPQPIPRRERGFPTHRAERGAVLLVALVFLILLTLLAVGASSGSLLQQRMVAATRSAQLAAMSADTAVRGAEWRIWSTSTIVGNSLICDAGQINATTGCVRYDPSSPLYATNGAVTRFRTGDNTWLSFAGPITYKGADDSGYTDATDAPNTATANVAKNPQYLIEDMGLVKPPGAGPACESGATGCNDGGPGNIDTHIYRITARATGGTQNTVRVTQSTFDAQANN